MAIQRHTAISETLLKANDYQFHLVNDCDAPREIRGFEKPGMMTIKLSGIRLSSEHRIGFVNDLEGPTSTPFFW
jgi:hypothetical protein